MVPVDLNGGKLNIETLIWAKTYVAERAEGAYHSFGVWYNVK